MMVRFEVCLCLLSPIPLAVPCVVLGVELFLVMFLTFLTRTPVHALHPNPMQGVPLVLHALLYIIFASLVSTSKWLGGTTLPYFRDGSTSMPLLRPIRPFETIPEKGARLYFFAEFLEHFSVRGQTCRVDWSTRAFFALFGRASRHERFKSTFETFLDVGIDRFRRLRRTAAAKWRLVGRWVLPTGAGHTFSCIAKARRSRTRREEDLKESRTTRRKRWPDPVRLYTEQVLCCPLQRLQPGSRNCEK